MLAILSLQTFFALPFLAHAYPITGITISLPANPDASTAKWGTGFSVLSITVTGKLANGRVDTSLEGSKILVFVKRNGARICGAYTSASAPSANFTGATRTWRGTEAVSLLGKECTLPPGDYELCVQMFGQGATGISPLSEEKRQAFSIPPGEQGNYRLPQLILPVDGSAVSAGNSRNPIDFRWTPVVPRPREDPTYRVRVWQLMQGQSSAQAMHVNQPIITKDVDNLTGTSLANPSSGRCTPPSPCKFVWNVQTLDRDGKPIGLNNGTSAAFVFQGTPGSAVERE